MKTLKQLVTFYRCETSEQFFTEMSNCLEMVIDINNYQDYLSEFQECYKSYLNQDRGY